MVAGVSTSGGVAPPATVLVPIRIAVEDGGRVPVFADGKFVRLVVDVGSGIPASLSLDIASIELPFPVVPRDYRVSLEDLPAGYALKSITYDSADLTKNPLRRTAAGLPLAAAAKAASELSIVLVFTSVPQPPAGVRITGRTRDGGARSIYAAGKPGTVYSDGTFEFRGVMPGRYVVTADNPQSSSSLGASLVVGTRDIDGVVLEPVPVLPRETRQPDGGSAPGPVIPLAGLRGRLVSETTQQPLRGLLSLMGASTQIAYAIGADGRFEIPSLLPGSYVLQVSVFDYFTLTETIVVGEVDLNVQLRARRVY